MLQKFLSGNMSKSVDYCVQPQCVKLPPKQNPLGRLEPSARLVQGTTL